MSIRLPTSNRGDGERCLKFLGNSVDSVGSNALKEVHHEAERGVSSKGGVKRRAS